MPLGVHLASREMKGTVADIVGKWIQLDELQMQTLGLDAESQVSMATVSGV